MAANGISTLATKELRQKAKLDLAASNRAADGNARATYDLTELPTQYSDNTVLDNPNGGGLVVGRPWIATTSFTFYESFGTTSTLNVTRYVSGNKIYAESSTYDVPDYQNARIVVNDIEIVDTALRGHTLAVLDTYGDTVSITRFDTYNDIANATALAAALNEVAEGNIVVIVTYDASAVNDTLRTAINRFGSTNSNTWTASRNSEIFIGISPISIRTLLSVSGKSTYDAASNNTFFEVNQTDYEAVISGFSAASVIGMTDAQFAETGSNGGNRLFVMPQAQSTVPANNYLIGFKAVSSTNANVFKVYGSPTYTGVIYSQIGSTITGVTGSSGTPVTHYYLRKAPTVQAGTTYVGLSSDTAQRYGNTSFASAWTAGADPAVTSVTARTGVVPKIQFIISTTAIV